MALMLAPYNSAMRLGMGFNSYTQSLCVNDVVRKPGSVPATENDLRAAKLTDKADAANTSPKQLTAGSSQQQYPQAVLDGAKGSVTRTFIDGQKEVSQVVTWTAEFIENSSDVLKKLEVSGALSIKMAGLGSLSGKASFVDSSDIKTADINYLIHVKVVNQRLIGDNITEFTPIPYISEGQFTEIYGDCFVSGFIEGGEFDAIVSITTADTLKKMHIGGGLELSAVISGIEVSGKVEGAKDDNSTLKNAKTNIKVTWSGGGDIRDDNIKEWNLQALKEVAMSFPDAVAACPQRSSAILTKYTSLRSFHEQTRKGSPLDYENAGVYTAALYDAYTDYKMIWGEIQIMIQKLNLQEIQLYIREASPSLKKYAAMIAETQLKKEAAYKAAIEERKANEDLNALVRMAGGNQQPAKPIDKPLPANAVQPYDPDVFGLEVAASDCRFEMIKIVREVDAVTRDPQVACDPSRTGQYLSPSVFRLLVPSTNNIRLPTMEEWQGTQQELRDSQKAAKEKSDHIDELKKKLEAALITPRRQETQENSNLIANSTNETPDIHPSIRCSVSQLSYRADEYRMQSLLKDKNSISPGAIFFNDLEHLEPGARPGELRLWQNDKIEGLSVVYTTSKEIAHGKREGNPQHVLQLEYDEAITELEVYISKSDGNKLSVQGMAVATSKCNILASGTKAGCTIHRFSLTDLRQWSFRGFFGFTFDDGFEDLGIVWGKDVLKAATATVQAPAAKRFLGMGPSLQEKTKQALSGTSPAEHFYLGDCVSTGSQSTPTEMNSFSALDTIVGTSKITKLSFSASAGRLSGLKVEYSDGKQLIHGAYAEEREVWNCQLRGPIIAAKLTSGKTITAPEPFIDTVELVCGDETGQLPLWPLDVSTIRYLGDHTEEDRLEVVSKLVEQAPKLNRANWTLRGFYGEESAGLITRLGLIWGCA
ncbi:unnamed protein product [Clonostachys rhizophaga]|uniref:Jacalin-type lectin domain-containing protein n=1 Tax=Clonostachys rhizophaga TaxID=160324 RepID=A0A9N9VSF4_9HYPO|nr:unnamed protein product [Clonostachys rhizophaga]